MVRILPALAPNPTLRVCGNEAGRERTDAAITSAGSNTEYGEFRLESQATDGGAISVVTGRLSGLLLLGPLVAFAVWILRGKARLSGGGGEV